MSTFCRPLSVILTLCVLLAGCGGGGGGGAATAPSTSMTVTTDGRTTQARMTMSMHGGMMGR